MSKYNLNCSVALHLNPIPQVKNRHLKHIPSRLNNEVYEVAILNLPHNAVNHFHDDFVDGMEEVNNNFAAFSNGSQDGAEGETEEDDSKSVGSRPKYRKIHHYYL